MKQIGFRIALDLWRDLDAWLARYEVHQDGKVRRLTAATVVKALLVALLKSRFPALALVEEFTGAKVVEKE